MKFTDVEGNGRFMPETSEAVEVSPDGQLIAVYYLGERVEMTPDPELLGPVKILKRPFFYFSDEG